MYTIINGLAWAWVIIISILMITPGGVVVCLTCGPTLTKVIGVISLVLGIAGFIVNVRQKSVSR